LEAIEREQKEKMKLGTFVYRSVAEEKWRIRLYVGEGGRGEGRERVKGRREGEGEGRERVKGRRERVKGRREGEGEGRERGGRREQGGDEGRR
jgi:hypothetical protein